MSDYLHNGTREYNCQKYRCKTLEGNSKSKLKDNAKFNITIFDYILTCWSPPPNTVEEKVN